MVEIMKANHQWSTRPDDERFVTLDDLQTAVADRHRKSVEGVVPISSLQPKYDDGGELFIDGSQGRATLTNYSFGQLAQAAHAPAGYLRTLPAPLAAINLNWGLDRNPDSGKLLALKPNGHDGAIMALTSPTYGRIWDEQVVEAVQRANADGNWVVPAASYQGADPKRATTLYASDHDVFMFLVDPNRPIDVAGDQLFRGFMAWNSEVGSRTFGLMTFLYRRVCDNRIVWGASEVNKLIIRHTSGGPTRFAEQAAPALKAYAEGSTARIEAAIVEAKRTQIAPTAADAVLWLKERGFGDEVAKVSIALAEQEEGDPTTLWNVVQGATAYARSLNYTDQRVDMERTAGALLALI